MLFKTLKGRDCNISLKPYLIDWEHSVSRPQKRVKDFLYPYWKGDTVCEELKLPHSLLRLDLYNVSKSIVVEVSPDQHQSYNPFFHRSIAGFRASLKRDLNKEEWCLKNGLVYCELVSEDLDGELTPELFLSRFGVVL